MDSATEIKNLLVRNHIFNNVPEEMLIEIGHVAHKKIVPSQTIIFRQGDKGDSFYIISSGKVRVYRRSPEGIETELTVIGEGGYFGELALLTDKPRAGYAETMENTELVVIPKNQFEKILKIYPNIASDFINQLSRWIVQGNVKLEKERKRQIWEQRISVFDYLIIIGLSLFLGIGLNVTNPHGVRLIPQLSSFETFSTATLPYAKEKYRKGDAIFIDAMPVNFYNKEHIKGALNLPLSLFDIMYMLHFSGIEKEKELLVYGRTISRHYDKDVAQKLVLNGHNNIKILPGGLPAWKKNGNPIEP
jgi:CRP-like cAMP-binding protein/rhodanese-related sulfurtransferase